MNNVLQTGQGHSVGQNWLESKSPALCVVTITHEMYLTASLGFTGFYLSFGVNNLQNDKGHSVKLFLLDGSNTGSLSRMSLPALHNNEAGSEQHPDIDLKNSSQYQYEDHFELLRVTPFSIPSVLETF